jgi:hypothetical protein
MTTIIGSDGKHKCRICGEIKELIKDFPKDTHMKSGYKNHCKVCNRDLDKKRYYKDLEKYRAKSRRSRKKYYQNHGDKIREKDRIRSRDPIRKEYGSKLRKEKYKNDIQENPWLNSYRGAKARVNNSNAKDYPRYGGRGIKFLMTKSDFEHLWYRDNAELMDKPSIDRIDSDGNYELNNCRFIEQSLNTIRSNKKKEK